MLLTLGAAVITGIASHVFYFKAGEHHMLAIRYIQAFVSAFIAAIVALVQLADASVTAALLNVTSIATSYLVGIFGSLILYRLYFAPINKFPGPWQAKLSSLWFMGTTPHEDCYHRLDALHREHGRYVRIGSNDLSITDPEIMELAFGLHAIATKAEWYDGSKPFDSMHTLRNKPEHDKRRRIWAPAFSDKALREYEQKVQIFNDKLIDRVHEHKGGRMDMSKWFNLYSFDVMGQLSFGKDYGMLDSGERHWALELLVEGMSAAPPKPPVWMFRILLAIPGLSGGYERFLRFCKSELKWRVEHKNADKDITGW